jgi:hypothetical protein
MVTYQGLLSHQGSDAQGNTTATQARRMESAGALRVWVDFAATGEPSVPYTIRMHRATPASDAYRLTGQWAKLDVSSQVRKDRFSLVPVSVEHSLSNLSNWAVLGGLYQVALVSDSLYELCRLPCTKPDTITLKPSGSLTKQY